MTTKISSMLRAFIFFISIVFLSWSSSTAQPVGKGAGFHPVTIVSDTTPSFYVYENLPDYQDAIVTFNATPLNSKGHFGLILGYQSPGSWTYLGCDINADLYGRCVWFLSTPDTTVAFTKDINKPFSGIKRNIKVKIHNRVLSLWIEGEEIECRKVPEAIDLHPGKIGFRAWNGGAVKIDDFNVHKSLDLSEMAGELQPVRIASDSMTVLLDSSFPRVIGYDWLTNNAHLEGQPAAFKYIRINGEDYEPRVQLLSSTSSKIVYEIDVQALKINMHVQYLVEGNRLSMQVTRIVEKGDTKVKTIGFPNNFMVSVNHSQQNGKLDVSVVEYNFEENDVFQLNSKHEDLSWKLKERIPDACYSAAGIAVLSTPELAATLSNNVIQNLKEIRYQTVVSGQDTLTGLWNSDWIYRGMDGEITELPWSQVYITTDRNGDRLVDWQDGAIALREEITEPEGTRKLQNSFFHLDAVTGSMVQFSFLRWLDYIKKISLYTDGFGQIFQIKGYQNEGHDSAHPDYGDNFNKRAGGLAELKTLIDVAQRYNTEICLHINHSESYPEAKNFDPEIVSDIPAWEWWDQSYFIKRKPDILNGTFLFRLEQLHQAIPRLKFVYLDTYREERWIADYTARLFQSFDWSIYTEDNTPFFKTASWTHWSPGGKSRIARFVYHQHKDAFINDSLFWGGYESRNFRVSNLNGLIYSCMTNQLPNRYLMHFPLLKWTEKEAVFAGGITSAYEKNIPVIRKNGRLMASGRDVFIPWNPETEDKIYYFNTSGKIRTWELPESWTHLSNIKVYRLTDLGRKFVASVKVIDGIVNLNMLNDSIPYVMYKTMQPDVVLPKWGEGSLVKDPGFDSKSFEVWQKKASAPENAICIENSASGNAYLSMKGNVGDESYVYQNISDLEGGKTYALSAWIEVSDGRKAYLGVDQFGGQRNANYTDNGNIKCTVPSQKGGNYQRVRLLFTLPDKENTARIYLKTEPGDAKSFAHFDDVRLVAYNGTQSTENIFNENFEHVDEGVFPFIQADPNLRVHLAERHAPFTNDVINGNYSMKVSSTNPNGLMVQTLPCNVRFKPGERYSVDFEYIVGKAGIYRVLIKSIRGGDKTILINKELEGKGHFSASFKTGVETDYAIFIYRKGQYGDYHLVVDDLTIMQTN